MDGISSDDEESLTSSQIDQEQQHLLEKSNAIPRRRPDKREGSGGAFIVFLVLAVFICSFVVFSNGFTTVDVGIADETIKRLQMAKEGRVSFGSLSEDDQVTLFQDFQNTFKKAYDTKKEQKSRMKNFQDFLSRVDERNADEKKAGGSAVHGLTIFSDLSTEEFQENFMGYIPPKSSTKKYEKLAVSVDAYTGTKTNVDWAGIYTTPINNQQYCGSCWAFSTTQQIEADAIRSGLITPDQPLSVQQLISCDNKFNDNLDKTLYNYGCQGGNTEQAYEYVNFNGGMTLASDYEYTSGEKGVTGTCRTQQEHYVVTVDAYYALSSEDDMMNYVLSTGPLSVCLDATYWETYASGIVHSCGTDVNHCVQIVGVDTSEKYWKVRNTWGTEWGEDGYIRIALGSNTCAIATDPTYSKVSKALDPTSYNFEPVV